MRRLSRTGARHHAPLLSHPVALPIAQRAARSRNRHYRIRLRSEHLRPPEQKTFRNGGWSKARPVGSRYLDRRIPVKIQLGTALAAVCRVLADTQARQRPGTEWPLLRATVGTHASRTAEDVATSGLHLMESGAVQTHRVGDPARTRIPTVFPATAALLSLCCHQIPFPF